jgi:hypothetical protein
MLTALLRRLVPGLTTAACAVAVANLSISLIHSEFHGFDLGAAIRVGVPSFLVGMLFFPVNEQTLGNRLGFALRSGFAAAVSALAHRVLWTALSPDVAPPEFGVDFSRVLLVLQHPSLLWPPGSPDSTALLAIAAVMGSATAGFLAQPLLKALARGRRPTVASAISRINAQKSQASPLRVRG